MNEKALGAIIGGSSGLVLGASLGYLAGRRSNKKNKRAKQRKQKNKRRSARKKGYARKGKQKQPYTAGRKRDTSRRRIRYTSNNQPYVILANGRARFIKRSSVRNSRKRQGGRY